MKILSAVIRALVCAAAAVVLLCLFLYMIVGEFLTRHSRKEGVS